MLSGRPCAENRIRSLTSAGSSARARSQAPRTMAAVAAAKAGSECQQQSVVVGRSMPALRAARSHAARLLPVVVVEYCG